MIFVSSAPDRAEPACIRVLLALNSATRASSWVALCRACAAVRAECSTMLAMRSIWSAALWLAALCSWVALATSRILSSVSAAPAQISSTRAADCFAYFAFHLRRGGSCHHLAGVACNGVDHAGNLRGGFGGALGQFAHLVGSPHAKPRPLFAGACGLNGRVQRQEIGLVGNVARSPRRCRQSRRALIQRGNLAGCLLQLFGNMLDVTGRIIDQRPPSAARVAARADWVCGRWALSEMCNTLFDSC